jgi:hypothetical protein
VDFTTADEILNSAALELGLVQESMADPFTSVDQNIVQLRALLTRTGRQLAKARDWTQLVKEYTFPTVAATESYALPAGFSRMKDATAWNRDTANPLGMPVSSQQWQAMKAQTAAGFATVPFRIFGNLLYLYPTPTAAEDIYYEYLSKYWVVPTGQTSPTTRTPTAITDTLWFDEDLLVAALKLSWRRTKGQDTTGAQQDFNHAWDAVAGGDGAAAAISLTGNLPRFPEMGRPPSTEWGT